MSVLQAHMQSNTPQLQSVGVAGASVAAAAVEPSAVVVGAGCCGLAVALQLLYAGQRVVVLTKDTTPRTTSDAAGALWRPFGEVSDANRAVFSRWGKETFDFLNQLRLTHGSPATGIMLVSGFEVFSAAQAEPFWARDVLNFRMLNEEELRQVGLPAHKHGFSYTSIIIDMDVYMRWMHREFYRVGGKLHIHELRHLREARSLYPSARVLVNCTGLGAGELVRDTSVFPVAGHIVKMRLPGVHHFFMDAEAQPNPTYIFPRAHDVVVGGSYFKRDANTRPSIQTREDILARAARFVPEIATAPITAEYVGLRPYRDVTRLELDEAADAGLPVIHNYGHGGSGVTLHWGCGVTVMELAAKFLPPPTEKVHPQPVGAHVPSKL